MSDRTAQQIVDGMDPVRVLHGNADEVARVQAVALLAIAQQLERIAADLAQARRAP